MNFHRNLLTVPQAYPALALSQSVAWPKRTRWTALHIELLCLGALVVVFNLPLLRGACAARFIFLPDRFLAGEWWRLVTHPFIHVSPYHLVLDALAFLLLYAEFPRWSTARRLGAASACAIGSLLAALTSSAIASHGLCGLSGAAHGLMALSAVQWIRHQQRLERVLGTAALAGLIVKCGYEAVTGQIPLAGLHLGSVGVPIVVCHAGGVVAGLLFALLPLGRR